MSARLRPTWLEVDLGVIARNVKILRARVPNSARLMAVVKADAYGHGAERVAWCALQNGADFLSVAIPEEGVQLREAGLVAPILVLGTITSEGAEAVAQYRLTQTVQDVQTIAWLERAAARCGGAVDVHIKADTGMGRIGVRGAKALDALADAVLASRHLRLTGVFTHFAASDEEDSAYTAAQQKRFDAMTGALKARHPSIILHAANSATIFRFPQAAYDMVRAGIALYVAPGFPGAEGSGLSQAMRWVTHAVHLKEIEAGEAVGYGRRFIAPRPTRVMTLPVGYADGYHRSIGGRGRALVRGQSAPVIGWVCMDQTMLDVTDIPGAAVGDEAVLLGAQGGECISAREMGEWCGMIDYEIVLSPTERVPRHYINE